MEAIKRSATLATLLAFAGCSHAGQEGAVPPPKEIRTGGAAAASAVPADLLAAARADLDRRLAAEKTPGPVRVLLAEAVTWPDGAVGCPRPGMNYTMALVPGYRVVFAVGAGANERRYAYHSGRSGPLAYCATPGAPVGASSTI
jgi:hypothetical protein